MLAQRFVIRRLLGIGLVVILLMCLARCTTNAQTPINLWTATKPFIELRRVHIYVTRNNTEGDTLPLNYPGIVEESWAYRKGIINKIIKEHLKKHPGCDPFKLVSDYVVYGTPYNYVGWGKGGPFAGVIDGEIYVNLDRVQSDYDAVVAGLHEYTHIVKYCGPDANNRKNKILSCVLFNVYALNTADITYAIQDHFSEELKKYVRPRKTKLTRRGKHTGS